MTRRRWVQLPGQGLVEVDLNYVVPSMPRVFYVSDAWLDGTRSPIDGADIGSRTKHREHMKLHGVADAAEVMQDVVRNRASAQREFERSRAGDIAQAVARVQAGYKPNIERESE